MKKLDEEKLTVSFFLVRVAGASHATRVARAGPCRRPSSARVSRDQQQHLPATSAALCAVPAATYTAINYILT